MIRALFLDLDGTLFDRDAAHRRYCEDFAARHPDAFPASRRTSDVRALSDAGPDRRSFARLASMAFRGEGPSAAAIAADHARRLPDFIEEAHGLADLVRSWASRYRTAVVSNGSGPVQRAKLASLGLSDAFGRAFISGECGAAKPGPALFLRALSWAGCPAERALFVGDDPEVDIAGAGAVGLLTCWVSRGREFPAGLTRPGTIVDDVRELAGALP